MCDRIIGCVWCWLDIFGGFCSVSGVSNPADLTKGQVMRVSDTAKVKAFIDASNQFLRGSMTAKRGAVKKRTLKDGSEVTDKIFDILVHAGQVNGAPEKDAVVLVTKRAGIALFTLTEQVAEGMDDRGIAYTLWTGAEVQI